MHREDDQSLAVGHLDCHHLGKDRVPMPLGNPAILAAACDEHQRRHFRRPRTSWGLLSRLCPLWNRSLQPSLYSTRPHRCPPNLNRQLPRMTLVWGLVAKVSLAHRKSVSLPTVLSIGVVPLPTVVTTTARRCLPSRITHCWNRYNRASVHAHLPTECRLSLPWYPPTQVDGC